MGADSKEMRLWEHSELGFLREHGVAGVAGID